MLRGGGHDYRTDFSSAGVEDVIERLLQQLCRLLRSLLNHAERLRVHVPCDEVAITPLVCGDSSDGFMHTQLPAAIASAIGSKLSSTG